MEEVALKLFKFTRNTYYVWKREERPIMSLLSYLGVDNLQEFLSNKMIRKLELVKNYNLDELEQLLSKQIDINKIAPKLYKFQRRPLSYFYFLIHNKKIRNIDDFKAYIEQDITDAEEKSWLLFIKKHLLSIRADLKSEQISFNTFAIEFKEIYQDYISDSEIEFLLKNSENRNGIKNIIKFIIAHKLYRIE